MLFSRVVIRGVWRRVEDLIVGVVRASNLGRRGERPERRRHNCARGRRSVGGGFNKGTPT
jgi:hypothetical protein